MRSLTLKLTLAFLFIGLAGAMLVAIIVRASTQSAFDQFILSQEQQVMVDSLLEYYQLNGSWQGLLSNLPRILDVSSPENSDRRDPHRNGAGFTLVGADRKIIFGAKSDQIGVKLSSSDLDSAIELKDGDEAIGWLILSSSPRQWEVNTPEERFLRTVNSAILLSALVAAVLALVMGSFLAVTMTRSLRELTEATVEIARGKLGKQVKVRSKDELGRLAESFNKMSLDLERATQARRQMTADIAHELRSPMSVISGYAEALTDGKLPGTPETYEILYQETRHLNRMVDDLRTLSLADAGELSLYLQPVQPRVILERAVARHAVTAVQKGINLRVDLSNDLPEVALDVERIAQVLDNLITNAFRYTPSGGEVVLSAEFEGDHVQIQVRDTGSGIAPEDLAYIFDRFYRADKSRHPNGESGLGLTIARSIVESHGGTIWVQSLPGQGSVFSIRLKADRST